MEPITIGQCRDHLKRQRALVTLQGLRDTINADPNSPAVASIVQTAPGSYRLVLTGKNSGVSNSFTIQSAQTGSTVAFAHLRPCAAPFGHTASDVTGVLSSTCCSCVNIPSAITEHEQFGLGPPPAVTLTLRQKDPHRVVVLRHRDACHRLGADFSGAASA